MHLKQILNILLMTILELVLIQLLSNSNLIEKILPSFDFKFIKYNPGKPFTFSIA